MSEEELLEKYEKLKAYLASFQSLAVAYSSGVDSTFLLHAAVEALGSDRVIALTAASCSFPRRELTEAETYCRIIGVRHLVVEANELEIEGFAQNPPNRCYLCKKDLFHRFLDKAKSCGIDEVVEGSNLDDEGDYRPGLQAITELDIKSPLRTFGFTKDEIRRLSKRFSLPTWNKQSFACLSSRFPYGEEISQEKLGMVDRAEQFLLDQGFSQFRVRVHGSMARIEIRPEEFERMMQDRVRIAVVQKLKEIGFTYIAMDLQGFRSGSMNETLKMETE